MREFEIVSEMIKTAEKEGLLVEVIWSFADYLSSSEYRDYSKAADYALSEWDI